MTWLIDGLTYLKEQFSPTVQDVGGRMFSDKTFTEIKPKPPEMHGSFDVTTLGALRDLINANVEKMAGSDLPMLHIVNHQEVRLLTGISDEHGRRRTFAKAVPPSVKGYSFDTWYSLEQFRIAIQAHLALTPDREYLLAIASKVTDGEVVISEDDGVSQQVEMKAGLALKGSEKLRARVELAPFRTFAEVDQPKSEFIFRAQKTDKGPQLALFEADGGKWKVTAVENIAYRLKELGISLPVIA
jgi:hypothetical protein